MAQEQAPHATTSTSGVKVYSPRARAFHWLTVAVILIQVSVGFYMHYRGNEMEWTNADGELQHGLFDAFTGILYDSHKLLGVTILLIILARLVNRMMSGAPSHEPTIEPWQKISSTIVHWALYAVLIVTPVLGYLGASYYGATTLFNTIKLPALVAKDKPMAEEVLEFHEMAVYVLLALIAVHVAAAIYHYTVRKDNVLARMLPGLLKR